MMTKTRLKEHLEKLPEEFSLEDLIDRLIFIDKIEEGLEQSKRGEVISTKELESKMEGWFK